MEYQEREASSSQLAALTAELEENQKATDNLMKAIEAGIITATTKQRLLDLETKAKDLKRAIELEKLSHVRLEREQILYWLEQFQGGSLQNQEFRRKVIDTFVSVVYLSDDHLRIAFNYSGQNRSEADFNLIMDAETASADYYPINSLSLPLCPPHKKNPNLFPLGKRFGFFICCISYRVIFISSLSSAAFLSMPPAYPVRLPFAPTTRWQGMMIEITL